MNEADLRAMLRTEAQGFRPDPAWLSNVAPAPRRLGRRIVPVVGAAAAALAAVVFFSSSDMRPVQNVNPASGAILIKLTGYEAPKDGDVPLDLHQHVACMRDEGFDLPDPEWTGNGWQIRINDPKSFGFGSMKWKKAAFGTCALVRDRATYDRWIRRAILHPRRS